MLLKPVAILTLLPDIFSACMNADAMNKKQGGRHGKETDRSVPGRAEAHQACPTRKGALEIQANQTAGGHMPLFGTILN